MAASQLKESNDAQEVACITSILSEKTKAIAHPGDKWRTGYLTLSRLVPGKNSWRSTHMSKKAFEKFCENFEAFENAFKTTTQHQLMLTPKQHIMITRFQREGKDTLYYFSLLHPTSDQEVLSQGVVINHAKTINLSFEEFMKLKTNSQKLLEVVRSRSEKDAGQESPIIETFRWTYLPTGTRSRKVFLTKEHCSRDAWFHSTAVNQMDPHPLDEVYLESSFKFEAVQVQRPSKLHLIEHLAYTTVQAAIKELREQTEATGDEDGAPTPEHVEMAIGKFDKQDFCHLVRRALIQLSYRNVYLTNELVDIFLYVKGMDKIKDIIIQHRELPSDGLYTRLLDYCYDRIMEQKLNA